MRLLERLLARLFAFAKHLNRVSDRIIYMALRKTLFETRFFYAGRHTLHPTLTSIGLKNAGAIFKRCHARCRAGC